MKCVGIDASLTALALCWLDTDGGTREATLKSNPAQSLPERMARVESLAAQVVEFCRGADYIAIEGYAHGRVNQAHYIGELGHALRSALCQIAPVAEVPPATVKLFACGKGTGSKVAVASALAKRYGREFRDDNQADAFALALLMLCAATDTTANAAQRKAVSTVQRQLPAANGAA